MELSEVLVLKEEDKQFSVRDAISEIRQMAIDALAPSPVSLESIGIIVNSLPKSVLMHCALFPANDAGVYLQGRFQEGKLSVYVQKTQMTYIAKTAERREAMKNIAVNEESATHLSELVSMLFA